MAKKALLDVGDYERLVVYIASQHGYFNNLISPAEIDAIFKRVTVIDLPDAPAAPETPVTEKKEE